MRKAKLTTILLFAIAVIGIFILLKINSAKHTKEVLNSPASSQESQEKPSTAFLIEPEEKTVITTKTEQASNTNILSREETEILAQAITENSPPSDIEPLTEEDAQFLIENEIIDDKEAENILKLEKLLEGEL
ncbi:MAG: hypothetical protein KAV18_04460 [Candidatus Omnitrophica bacterium]|nr:hypothetical protein [Candidatus Omnitrophota bacterium]